MKIYEYTLGTPIPEGNCVLALGFFDGVHLAHRELFSRAADAAKKRGLPFGIFTFPTDSNLKSRVKRLYPTEQKLKLLGRVGADFVILADFDSVSGLSPEEFVRSVLIRDCSAKVAVCGYNFKFGKFAVGHADTLTHLMREAGGDTLICEELHCEGKTVSATVIRQLLGSGKITEANKLLGAPYFITGKIIHGNSKGHLLGFPTINLPISSRLVEPRHGVYSSAAVIDGRLYRAITNVGTCPTFDERSVHAECFLLNFSGDLYGKQADIYLLDFIRDEKHFESEKELKMQINIDINKANNDYGEISWQELGLK